MASRKKFEDTVLEAELGCQGVSDGVDAVVEALGGKLFLRLKLIVGQQGVVNRSNPCLFTTILLLILGKGEEEEGCKDQRQISDGRHLKRLRSTDLLSAVLAQLLWEDMTCNICANGMQGLTCKS